MAGDGAGEVALVEGDAEVRVEAAHGGGGVGDQVLVADQGLPSPVGLEGPAGGADAPHVGAGPQAGEGLGFAVGEGLAVDRAAAEALAVPAALAGGVQHRGNHVPGVPDQEHHAALGERLHQERRPDRAVRLLDDEKLAGFQVGVRVAGAVEHEVTDGLDPAAPDGLPHHVVL